MLVAIGKAIEDAAVSAIGNLGKDTAAPPDVAPVSTATPQEVAAAWSPTAQNALDVTASAKTSDWTLIAAVGVGIVAIGGMVALLRRPTRGK